MTKYIIGEIFSSVGATLYKNPSDQTVQNENIKTKIFLAIPSQTEAQYICQVRGCRKLFVEAVQIEAHLKHHRNYIPTNGNFECKCCPETFTRKEQLDQHILGTTYII